jgi:tetratricopeptide (TPR) repeat protein
MKTCNSGLKSLSKVACVTLVCMSALRLWGCPATSAEKPSFKAIIEQFTQIDLKPIPAKELEKISESIQSAGLIEHLSKDIAWWRDRANKYFPPVYPVPEDGMVIRPRNPHIYLQECLLRRALAFEKLRRFSESDADFAECVRQTEKGGDPYVCTDRAFYYERQGKITEAQADWDRAVNVDRQQLQNRAEFFERIGKYESAYNDFITISPPGDLFYLIPKVLYLERRGDIKAATEILEGRQPAFSAYMTESSYLAFFERQGQAKELDDYYACEDTPSLETLAQSLERQAKIGEAEKIRNLIYSRQIDILHRPYPPAAIECAEFFERHGKFAEALKKCNSIGENDLNGDLRRIRCELARIRLLNHQCQAQQARDLATKSLLKTEARILPWRSYVNSQNRRTPGQAGLPPGPLPPYPLDVLSTHLRRTLGQNDPEPEVTVGCQKAQIYLFLGKAEEALSALADERLEQSSWSILTYAIALERLGCKQASTNYYRLCTGSYVAYPNRKSLVGESLCAKFAHRQLENLGVHDVCTIPKYVEEMQFVPLALMRPCDSEQPRHPQQP